jgi:hypothetical protein
MDISFPENTIRKHPYSHSNAYVGEPPLPGPGTMLPEDRTVMSPLTLSTRVPRAPRQAPSIELTLNLRPVPALPPSTLLPSIVIPGVSHSGAAMLSADLGRHPEVCLPRAKRLGLFTPLRFGRAVEGHLDDYDRHFANWAGQRYRVETAPDYFDGGRGLVESLGAGLPGVRILVLLRDPAHRLWTSYTDKLARGRLPRAMSYETYVERSLALRANGADRFEGNRHFRTLSSGFYAEYLPSWLETFGRRVRVVFTEDLQDEPAAQVGAVFDWLGLNPGAATPPLDDDTQVGGYPPPEPAPMPFNRRLWPVLQRTPGPWREPEPAGRSPLRRVPRQSDRARTRVRSLYAGGNRELATMLCDHGYTALPDWLASA